MRMSALWRVPGRQVWTPRGCPDLSCSVPELLWPFSASVPSDWGVLWLPKACAWFWACLLSDSLPCQSSTPAFQIMAGCNTVVCQDASCLWCSDELAGRPTPVDVMTTYRALLLRPSASFLLQSIATTQCAASPSMSLHNQSEQQS